MLLSYVHLDILHCNVIGVNIFQISGSSNQWPSGHVIGSRVVDAAEVSSCADIAIDTFFKVSPFKGYCPPLLFFQSQINICSATAQCLPNFNVKTCLYQKQGTTEQRFQEKNLSTVNPRIFQVFYLNGFVVSFI